MCQTNDPNIEKYLSGEDFTAQNNDEFRERMINELRTYPNLLIFCSDSKAASHYRGGDQQNLAKGIISVLRNDKMLFEWIKTVINYV